MTRRVMLCAVLALSVIIPAAALADPVTLSGTVVDGDGQPIVDAEVWAISFDSLAPPAVLAGSTRSDGEGRFAIPDVEFTPDQTRAYLNVAAWCEGLAVGWATVRTEPTGLRVVCSEAKPYEGRIADENARGLPARVTVNVLRSTEQPAQAVLRLPDDLAERLAVETDADGRFTVGWLPAGVRSWTKIVTSGFGTVTAYRATDKPIEIVLSPPGTVLGQVVCPESPEAVAGLKVTSWRYDQETGLSWGGDATTDGAGRFEIAELQPGSLVVSLRAEPNSMWQATPGHVTVRSGETAEVEINLQRTYELTGRVVDGVTGAPIEGVQLYASPTPGGTDSVPVTDAEGRYHLRVLPGRSVVYPTATEGYATPEYAQRHMEVIVTDQDVELQDIALQPGATVQVCVVDDAGRPVADAEVYYTGTGDLPGMSRPYRTDQNGEVLIRDLDPDQALKLRACSGELMTAAPVTVEPSVERLVELVLRYGAGALLAVRVVDMAGAPIPGAEVSAYWQNEDYGTRPTLGMTDADGRLVSEPQWPEGNYRVAATAPGYSKAEGERWDAVSGETHDFGDLALVRAGGLVAGRVVDGEGAPVAGAVVTNRGDGPIELRTQADEQGHFRLEGLYPGHACVIAEKGDLFGGTRVEVGCEDAVVTVTPDPTEVVLGEPIEVTPLTDRQTCRQVALTLIEEALAWWPDERRMRDRAGFVAQLAKIDPGRALNMSADANGAYDQRIFAALGDYLLPDRPDEAFAYLGCLNDARSRAIYTIRATKQLVDTDPERVRQELLALIPQVSEIPEPMYRAASLARAGEALYALDPEAAVPVIRQAEEIAQTLPLSEWSGYARGCAAEALCHFDLEGALALIADLSDEHEARRHQPNIAARIAADDPTKAIELMAVADDWNRGRKTPRVVYAMAPAYPDLAVEFARQATEPYDRARSLGYIALALRPTDPARSARVFAEAVSTLTAPQSSSHVLYADSYPATMAELAHIGAKIGYPDIDRLVWRTIAMRPAPSSDPWGGSIGEGVHLRVLGFVAPELTAELIRDHVQRHPLAAGTGHSDGVANVLGAAAACNALLAADLARSVPADPPGEESAWFERRYLDVVTDLLRTPRQRYIEGMSRYGQWVPGADAD